MNTATDQAAHSADEAWYIHSSGAYREPRQTSVTEVLRLLGADMDAESRRWANSIELPLWRIPAGTTFLRADDLADAIHVVRFGYFKIVKIAEDGYQQVRGLAGPGDVLGFEGAALGRHPLEVAALDDCSVIAVPLSELRTLRHQSQPFDQALMRALGEQLAHAGDTASLMAPVAAEARLARFVLWMSARMAAHGESPRRFLLRMSRRDIANLLAVAHETISRSFSQMVECGYLKVDGREVEILDLAALQACSLSTRREKVEVARRPGSQRSATPAAVDFTNQQLQAVL
jgi:CRP/FNR family transcriptional regulator